MKKVLTIVAASAITACLITSCNGEKSFGEKVLDSKQEQFSQFESESADGIGEIMAVTYDKDTHTLTCTLAADSTLFNADVLGGKEEERNVVAKRIFSKVLGDDTLQGLAKCEGKFIIKCGDKQYEWQAEQVKALDALSPISDSEWSRQVISNIIASLNGSEAFKNGGIMNAELQEGTLVFNLDASRHTDTDDVSKQVFRQWYLASTGGDLRMTQLIEHSISGRVNWNIRKVKDGKPISSGADMNQGELDVFRRTAYKSL